MKRILLLFALTAAVYAQDGGQGGLPPNPPKFTANVTEHNLPVTHSDLYCAGFVGKPQPHERFVAGGLNTPHQARFTDRDYIYLRGTGYQPGTRVSIIREMRDPNKFDPFHGERKLLEQTGQLYGDIGYAVVIENRGKDTAVAQIEFSCESAVPGDLVVPFVARQPVSYRLRSTMDTFPENPSPTSGRIVAARDFDRFFAAGEKIYLNLGADRGVKAGDYFRIVRGYRREDFDGADNAIFGATIAEDTQKHRPPHKVDNPRDLPRHVVGEALVLSTQPGSATAMITFALQEVHIGDGVELEEGQRQ